MTEPEFHESETLPALGDDDLKAEQGSAVGNEGGGSTVGNDGGDFAGEHSDSTFAGNQPGGLERAAEQESPRGRSGMDE